MRDRETRRQRNNEERRHNDKKIGAKHRQKDIHTYRQTDREMLRRRESKAKIVFDL